MSQWPTNTAWYDVKSDEPYEVFIGMELGKWPVAVLFSADQAATYLALGGERKVYRATVVLGAELSLLPEVTPAARLVEKGWLDDADG